MLFRSANTVFSKTTFQWILSPKCYFFWVICRKTGRNPYVKLLTDRLQMIHHLTVPSFMAVMMIFSIPVACSSSVGIPGKLIFNMFKGNNNANKYKAILNNVFVNISWGWASIIIFYYYILFWLLVSERIVLHERRKTNYMIQILFSRVRLLTVYLESMAYISCQNIIVNNTLFHNIVAF